jgi:hypothetical protein
MALNWVPIVGFGVPDIPHPTLTLRGKTRRKNHNCGEFDPALAASSLV